MTYQKTLGIFSILLFSLAVSCNSSETSSSSLNVAVAADNAASGDKEYTGKAVEDNEVDVNAYMKKFNKDRKDRGLKPMKLSRKLVKAGATNNRHQIQRQVSGHYTQDHYTAVAVYGEDKIDSVIQMWQEFPSTRVILLGGYNCTGIHKLGLAWTQVFENTDDCKY